MRVRLTVNGSGLIPLTMLILIGLSFASRYSWRTTGLTAVLFGLLIVQFSLAAAGLGHLPFVGGFHAVNAVLLVSYAAWTVVSRVLLNLDETITKE